MTFKYYYKWLLYFKCIPKTYKSLSEPLILPCIIVNFLENTLWKRSIRVLNERIIKVLEIKCCHSLVDRSYIFQKLFNHQIYQNSYHCCILQINKSKVTIQKQLWQKNPAIGKYECVIPVSFFKVTRWTINNWKMQGCFVACFIYYLVSFTQKGYGEIQETRTRFIIDRYIKIVFSTLTFFMFHSLYLLSLQTQFFI